MRFLVNRRILMFLVFFVSYLSSSYTENVFSKTMSDVQCKHTEEKLVYDCMIFLTDKKNKKKISGAKFTVGADMPSMPGTHNVKPIMAHSKGLGIYHVRLNLEMYGEWVLKLDFTKPKRDRIVKKMFFGGKSNDPSHEQNLMHKNNEEDLECHHNHAKEHKHEKGEMPMKHDD